MENVFGANQARVNIPPQVTNNKNVQQSPAVSPQPVVPKGQGLPPEQGGIARPPIDNISNQVNPTQTTVQMPVGQVQPGVQAEYAAAQMASKKVMDKKATEDVKEKIKKAESVNEASKSILNTSEADLITDMRDTIGKKAMQVTKKVNRSAFKYMYDKTSWLNKENAVEAEKFFTIKIPTVLANELSKILNSALGLEDDSENV